MSALAEGMDPESIIYKKITALDEGGVQREMDDIIEGFTEHNALRQKSWDDLVLGKDRLILREGMADMKKSMDDLVEELAEMQENFAASYKLKDMAGGTWTSRGISTIQKVDEVYRATKDKIKNGIIQMLKPAGKAARQAARGVKVEGSAMEEGVKLTEELKGRKVKSKKEEEERFKEETDEISRLHADPQMMMVRLGDSLQELSDVAPVTAISANQTAQRAINFAFANIPSTALQGNLVIDSDYIPSSEEMFQWRTVMRAIEDPLVMIDELAAGFVQPKTMEAVKTVYPEMYSEMQRSIIDVVSDLKTLSIPQQMLISEVFGVQGPYLRLSAGLQATYKTQTGSPLQAKTGKVQNLSNLIRTPLQRVSIA
jgi:hypothetical protein